ncbi:MAG: hypothetical protein ACRDGI_07105, partial [Candidatus Limnocylindrales bacterium]
MTARRPPPVAIRVDHLDQLDAPARIAEGIGLAGGRLRTWSTVRHVEGDPPLVEVELETEGAAEAEIVAALGSLPVVRSVRITRALDRVFGKRVIVIGGGAQ